MKVSVSTDKSRFLMRLDGRFDFDAHREFKTSYEDALGSDGVDELEVDFANVDYMDSSALGMLLLLRERAQAARKAIALTNCRGAVKQVLEIANFQRLFSIR